MALQILKGRITNYKRKREEASFVFTDDDREGLGAIAIAASLAGLSGQAISTTSAAASAEEEADYLEFEIDGKPVKGWVWRSPFKESDEVEVAAEWRGEHYELGAIARPTDRIVAMYPHCSRGSGSHWRNAWKWWMFGTAILLLVGGGLIEVYMQAVHSRTVFFSRRGLDSLLFLVAFFFPVFALMTWSLARKWMPFVRLSEKVFRAFGWDNPASVDLVKRSKEGKMGDEKPEYGVFYFRY
ncbi:MAG: hypothetical protein CVU18_21555 [Betaproteobacteria bacterium HGW-Betaproteobacteria-12]|nr:MAG: hypothetical protein CVU18_21555 [Betaproteobacteria bacterium HGW-Betaproteobacteria-12]